MPFGSATTTYKVNLTRDEFFLGNQQEKVPWKKITVEAEVAPWWWSEYLLEEWERTHLARPKRDRRTGWQRAQDEWKLQAFRWSAEDPHAPETGLHRAWESLS